MDKKHIPCIYSLIPVDVIASAAGFIKDSDWEKVGDMITLKKQINHKSVKYFTRSILNRDYYSHYEWVKVLDSGLCSIVWRRMEGAREVEELAEVAADIQNFFLDIKMPNELQTASQFFVGTVGDAFGI